MRFFGFLLSTITHTPSSCFREALLSCQHFVILGFNQTQIPGKILCVPLLSMHLHQNDKSCRSVDGFPERTTGCETRGRCHMRIHLSVLMRTLCSPTQNCFQYRSFALTKNKKDWHKGRDDFEEEALFPQQITNAVSLTIIWKGSFWTQRLKAFFITHVSPFFQHLGGSRCLVRLKQTKFTKCIS